MSNRAIGGPNDCSKASEYMGEGMRGRFILFIVLSRCLIAANAAFADDNNSKLSVMTQNLSGLLQATTFADFLVAVDFAYNNMNATKPAERLAAIANEISANKVDIVGLQEASIWRTGPSSLTGPAMPAENVEFDF